MSDPTDETPSFWREVALDLSDFAQLLCVIFILPPLLTGSAAALIEWVRG